LQPIERIVWVDSGLSFASTWLDTKDIIERAKDWNGRIVSVGQVIYEDDERLVLGINYDPENDNWAACFLIGKVAILNRVRLEDVQE